MDMEKARELAINRAVSLYDRLKQVIEDENMPTVKQILTWSASMINETEKWVDPKIRSLKIKNKEMITIPSKPYFFRYYERKLL